MEDAENDKMKQLIRWPIFMLEHAKFKGWVQEFKIDCSCCSKEEQDGELNTPLANEARGTVPHVLKKHYKFNICLITHLIDCPSYRISSPVERLQFAVAQPFST